MARKGLRGLLRITCKAYRSSIIMAFQPKLVIDDNY